MPTSDPAIISVETKLRAEPRTWLVTGAAGFIGSHLCERLLILGQQVVGFDNFDTGKRENIEALLLAAREAGAEDAGERLRVVEADVRDAEALQQACAGAHHVLHHAAVASVPRTLAEPTLAHTVNVDGTFHVLEAARTQGVRSVVHATSSAVYGDFPGDPETGAQREASIGRPLSPYAGHKRIAELLGQTWATTHGMSIVGLRYFNIVGARQDPKGAYAAVIPKWVSVLGAGEGPPVIFGDGETTRDFCPVEDVVQANLLAATWADRASHSQRQRPADPSEGIFNVGLGARTSLLELFTMLRDGMAELGLADCADLSPRFEPFREGDVRHSRADITRAREQLGYAPQVELRESLRRTMRWLTD